jgi:peptidoglycan-associated lipoprotein
MHTFSRLFLATALACTVLLAGGCGPKQVSPYAGGAGAGSDDSMGGNRMGNITEETGPGVEGLDSTGRGGSGSLANDADQQSDAYKRAHGRSSPEFTPIYFDYDHSGIRSDQIPSMEHNGGYLKSNSSARVLIEGNTDNRGTNEYNLALGERRAMSAKTYLIEFGIEESRIRTVSYGEERPLFNGGSEDDYAHNRRDDFILE